MTITFNSLDGLLHIRNGYPTARWNFFDAIATPLTSPGGIGNSVTITYSFLSAIPDYSADTQSGFEAFSDIQKDAARAVLKSISQIAEIKFVEIPSGGDISFGMSAQTGGNSGFAYPPSFRYSYLSDSQIITVVDLIPQSGDVWFNSNIVWSDNDFVSNGYAYGTLVHEIGHVLGLKHPFEGNYQLSPEKDNHTYTVMSYNYHPYNLFRTVTSNGAGNYVFHYEHIKPETLMPLDIEAIQYLYGANTTYNNTNTVYKFDPARPFIKTIWDGGGTDTISIANFTRGSTIKLQAGAFSSINIPSDSAPPGFTETNTGIYNGTDNLAIAYDTVIENAIGGSGNDKLIGNHAANNLQGGAGNDTLDGNKGKDTLDGGNGTDKLIGGAGSDIFILTHRSGVDTISDFSVIDDTIWLRGFSGLKISGPLAESRFVLGNQALDANDLILYDAPTGILFYDSDGNGSAAAVKIAVVGANLEITHADLTVV